MTRNEAKKLIDTYKNDTGWYGDDDIDLFGEHICTFDRMYELFRYRCQFGEAETNCLLGALKLSGAKIRQTKRLLRKNTTLR